MEEVNRYAGGRSDPARLAANFAGWVHPMIAETILWSGAILQ
jgi:hypothetical protein